MDNLRAAILRPQVDAIDSNGKRWNERYDAFAGALQSDASQVEFPTRHAKAYEIPSSIQFTVSAFSDTQNEQFLAQCANRGVDLKWFGAADPKAYTSRYDSWKYLEETSLPRTDNLLSRLYDCRLPLTFSVEDCDQIGSIIANVINTILSH